MRTTLCQISILLGGLLLIGAGCCSRWELSTRRLMGTNELRGRAESAFRYHHGQIHGMHQCDPDYSKGWTEGYYQVLRGGSPEPPLIPAPEYWLGHLQPGFSGPQAELWRQGYVQGAAAAVACSHAGSYAVPAASPNFVPAPFDQVRTVDCGSCTPTTILLGPDGMLNNPVSSERAFPQPLPPTSSEIEVHAETRVIQDWAQPQPFPTQSLQVPEAVPQLPPIESVPPPPAESSEESEGQVPSPSDRTPAMPDDLTAPGSADDADDDLLFSQQTQPEEEGGDLELRAAMQRLHQAAEAMREQSPTARVARSRQPLPLPKIDKSGDLAAPQTTIR